MQVRHLPNRDHRKNGVTTLKCASAHVPRFLTGSDPPISDRQLPFRPPMIAQAVYTAHRRAAARDGFLALPSPPGECGSLCAAVHSLWITPLPPPLTALGKGSHGSVFSENYAPNRLSSG